MKATAKQLRFHCGEILDAVSRGEEVIITYRGKPRAKLLPLDNKVKEKREETTLFGIWRDNEKIKDVKTYIRTARKGRFQ